MKQRDVNRSTVQQSTTPIIKSISPREVGEDEAPITLTIQGSGFNRKSRVRLFRFHEKILKMDFKPTMARNNRLVVEVGSEWFEVLAKTPNPPTNLHGLRIPADSFSVMVVDPDGQSSNVVGVCIKRFIVRVSEISPNGPIHLQAGKRREITVAVDRRKWTSEIPIKVLAFEEPRIRRDLSMPKVAPGVGHVQSGICGRVRGIEGIASIPAGQGTTRIKIKLEAAKYVPPGKYQLAPVIPKTEEGPPSVYRLNLGRFPISVRGVFQPLPIPPTPPTDFWVSLSGVNAIKLYWTDISGREDGYDIQRRLSPNPEWTTIATLPPQEGWNWFIDDELEQFTEYCYRLRIWKGSSEAFTEEKCARTTIPPPAAPTNLTIIGTTETSMSLRWFDNATDEDRFQIRRYVPSNGGWVADAGGYPAAELSPHPGIGWMQWTDSGLTPGQAYAYKVRVSKFDGYQWSGSETAAVIGQTEESTPPPPGPADLGFSGSMDTDPWPVHPYETFIVQWLVCNYGGTETGNFTDLVQLNGGVADYWINPGSIPPGECYLEWVYYPNGLPEGYPYWYVYLDAYNEVIENNLGNNINYLGLIIQ